MRLQRLIWTTNLDHLWELRPIWTWFLTHRYELTITPEANGYTVTITPTEQLPIRSK